MKPVLHIDRTPFEMVLDFIAILALGVMAWVLYASWAVLPQKVPVQFGTSGTPDAWGSKTILLGLMGIALVVYLGLTLVGRIPHLYNYPYPVTEANAERQYLLARSLVVALRTEIVVVSAYIERQTIRVATIRVALGRAEGLGQAAILIFLALVFGTIAAYFVQASRAR